MSHSSKSLTFGHRKVELSGVSDFRRKLLNWWGTAQRAFPWRLPQATTYHQIVSEVLLQRTRAETVAAFWPTFIHRFPNWRAIAQANTAEVEEVLRPIGLAKQRAPRLQALGSAITKENGLFPEDRSKIEALPGVGQYIANSVLTFCHGKPKPLLDVNMARLLERYFGNRKMADIRYDPYIQDLAEHVISIQRGKELNWAILDFAALVCRSKRPTCSDCPLAIRCLHNQKALSNF